MTTLTLMLVLSAADATPAQAAAQAAADVRVQGQGKPDLVIKWNEVVLQAIREDRTPPPLAARNLALVHIAIYDTVMGIERTHVPFLVEATPVPGISLEAAAAAADRVLVGVYPKHARLLRSGAGPLRRGHSQE